MTQDELTLVLDALKWCHGGEPCGTAEAIAVVEKALAQEQEQVPVAWPCLIAEADFSENTVILAMQCTDYKVSAGNHWLSNTPPQRTWVGLTESDVSDVCANNHPLDGVFTFARAVEAKLKEKNSA